jgi:hypothetical protein
MALSRHGSIIDTQRNNTPPLCLVPHYICCYAVCLNTECHYAEYRYAECRYAECHCVITDSMFSLLEVTADERFC